MENIQPGAAAHVEVIVRSEHLADSLASEDGEGFPGVFSTPSMLAQLERAAAKVLRPYLQEGQVSVGAKVELVHVAPTPPGQSITAHAVFLQKEGALYIFEIWAEDGSGEIGRGSHARAIVPRTAVESRAAKRFAPK